MSSETSRRDFLLGGTLTSAALLAAGTSVQAGEKDARPKHGNARKYPRDHAGPGGPLGSATDRGKLVPGLRTPGLPPVPVVTPDLPKLPWKMKNGAKEFHL